MSRDAKRDIQCDVIEEVFVLTIIIIDYLQVSKN